MLSRPTSDSRAYRLTTVGLVGVLAVVVFGNSWGVFTTDIKPEVYLAPGAMLRDYVSAWTFSPYLGGPNFNAGLAPVVLVMSALRSVGLSPEIAFKVFHLILWIVAAWGATRLARRLDPRIGRHMSLLAGILYVANPYAVSAGATLAILLPMAWLPWQVLCLLRALDEPRSWRWPALFGLTFFLMSGMNAGVVPVLGLLTVIPVAAHARRERGLTWRATAWVVAKCALFVVWLSGYWLTSATSAASTGSSIVKTSESFTGIAEVSSFAEVLRGLGLWPLYGSDAAGPWVPQHAMYVDDPLIVFGTFVASALAILALGGLPPGVRRLLVGMTGMAAVVMVGLYPPESPSLVGRGLRWTFENLPALSAFRTTNKIGAVLVLALAVAATIALGERWRRRRPRPVTVGLVGALIVVISLPAWVGQLYISPLEVPDYWREAAAVLDDGDAGERVLALPGGTRAEYRWTPERPDDVFNSLTTRDVLVPVTTPNTSPSAFNFTAALDDTFQSATSDPATTSTFARYVGAGDLLLRNDVVWERDGGIRPSLADAVVSADPGLSPVRNFGAAGENTISPTVEPNGFFERFAPPLQLYRVDDARPIVRAEAGRDAVVVAGDGWSVPAMARSGRLGGQPTFRYLHDLTPSDAAASLGPGHRIVLTDTNRRREAVTNRLTSGQGPLLTADTPLSDTSLSLGSSSDDQTVLEVVGGEVTATQAGYAFYDTPWGVPENAFDGDPRTSWIFGDFQRGAGQRISIRFDAPRTVGAVTVTQSRLGPVGIDRFTVRAGGATRSATFGPDGTATVDLTGVRASGLTLTADDLVGKGYNAVGITDIAIPGVTVTRIARTPTSLGTLRAALTPAQRSAMRLTPLDVLLTRAQGGPTGADDEEVNLERVVETVDQREFRLQADIRLNASREDLYDLAEGVPAGATSSGTSFLNPEVRASRAFDGDRGTGWVPGGDVEGSWLQQTGPARPLSRVTFDQRTLPGATETNWIRRVEVVADGRTLTTAAVRPGRTTIDLDDVDVPATVRTVRLVVAEDAGRTEGSPPRVVEAGLGRPLVADPDADTCLLVATIDGDPVRMRPVTRPSPDGSAWTACGGARTMPAGRHAVRSVDPSVTLDSLDLLDTQDGAPVTGPTPRVTEVSRGFGASMTVRTSATRDGDPYYLVLGQGYDARWRASIDGRDLGVPVILDGYSAGWLIDSTAAHTIDIQFGPQRVTTVAIVLTLLGLLLVGLLALPATWRRRLRPPTPAWLRGHRPVRPRIPSVRPVALARLGATSRQAGSWRPPAQARRPLVWVAVAALAWAVASWPGLVAGVVLLAWHLWRPPSRATLVKAGAALVLAAGVVFVTGPVTGSGDVSPSWISDHPWPNALAAVGFVLALVGAWRTDVHDTDPEERPIHA